MKAHEWDYSTLIIAAVSILAFFAAFAGIAMGAGA